LTFDECLRALDDGPAAPVYFLFGEERFFHTEILAALVHRLITPENRDFNYESFDAKSSPPGDRIGSARTFSFLGGTRLVVVRNLHEASLDDGGTRLLLDYAADPVGESCLAITCDRVDRKRKLFKKNIQIT